MKTIQVDIGVNGKFEALQDNHEGEDMQYGNIAEYNMIATRT
jgi:hypothetical protein